VRTLDDKRLRFVSHKRVRRYYDVTSCPRRIYQNSSGCGRRYVFVILLKYTGQCQTGWV